MAFSNNQKMGYTRLESLLSFSDGWYSWGLYSPFEVFT